MTQRFGFRWVGAAALVLLFGAAFGCAPAAGGVREAATWRVPADLSDSGSSVGRIVTRAGHDLELHCHRSEDFDPIHGPIWFVMHGATRDVERYFRIAVPVAERHGALLVVPYFDRQHYPRGSDYSVGMRRQGAWARDMLGRQRWLPPEESHYQEVERAFDAVVAQLGGSQSGYTLFGHSAGAQFVHRLLTFLPDHRVEAAVAANAGWYTLPVAEDSTRHGMPYGLGGLDLGDGQLATLFATPLTVLLGEEDRATADEDSLLRDTPEAAAQGVDRFARGQNYYRVAAERAEDLRLPFAWRLVTVPGAGHRASQMIGPAGELLFAQRSQPAAAGAASGGQR